MKHPWVKKGVFLIITAVSLLSANIRNYASSMPMTPKSKYSYLSPLKIPGPLKVEAITSVWKYPSQNIIESHGALCDKCVPLYLANLPKPGKIYHFNCGIKVEWPAVINNNNALEDGAVYVLCRYRSSSAAEQDRNPTVMEVTYAGNPQAAFYTYEDKEASSDTIYWYRLFVTDHVRRTMASNVFFASYQDNRPPAAPTGLRLEETSNAVKISWQAGAEPDLAGYLIYRRVYAENIEERASEGPFQLVGTMGKYLKPSFVDYYPPKSPGRAFMYCVKAIDKNQNISINTISNAICSHSIKKRDGNPH
ncbi:MAG TPA: hypothetical protein VHR47_06635 [Bacillota bacterium]|nr:hypothetical protein [Bacillota bacterium]